MPDIWNSWPIFVNMLNCFPPETSKSQDTTFDKRLKPWLIVIFKILGLMKVGDIGRNSPLPVSSLFFVCLKESMHNLWNHARNSVSVSQETQADTPCLSTPCLRLSRPYFHSHITPGCLFILPATYLNRCHAEAELITYCGSDTLHLFTTVPWGHENTSGATSLQTTLCLLLWIS